MTTKKVIITIVTVLAVAALAYKGKSILEERKAEIKNAPLPSVEAVTVPVVYAKEGNLENRVPFLAQILSDKGIKLSTKLAGYVEKVYVQESQYVKQGALLVMVDDTEIKSNIDALKATLNAQRNDLLVTQNMYMRNMKLYRVGGISKEKLDLSRAALDGKKAMVENTMQKITQLKHQLSYLKITAPFDGKIDTIFMHEGDLAATGKPILSMSNQKKKLIFGYAPTQENSIEKDQLVFWKKQKIGHIKTIYTTSQNGLVTAEVALSKMIPLPVGSSITIEVLTQEAKGCVIPDNTIVHKSDGDYVMVYRGEHFLPLKVNILLQNDNAILIKPCPQNPIAQASEVKLASLPAYQKVNVTGVKDE